MILDTILEKKRAEVARRQSAIPLAEMRVRAADAPPPRDFAAGLVRSAAGIPAVIAEVKKASPSKGLIREDFDPVAIARSYEAAGAAAISVLTDEEFFMGSLRYLTAVREVVGIPVLRKDFVIDHYQIYEARAAGADAVLLIVAALEPETLARLYELASELGMQCLVEAHDEREMRVALALGAGVVGVNNRNLQTFEVSLDVTRRLAAVTGETRSRQRLVSESGISTRNDMQMLGAIGADAVLIGEALMRERDIEAKLRELAG